MSDFLVDIEPIKVGFTGTRQGMTDKQFQIITELLIELGPIEVHHGDCIGADEEFNQAAQLLGIKRIAHPPENGLYRAFCSVDEIRPLRDYLVRDRNIVDEIGLLLATPKGYREELRSGTWATLRYARKRSKPFKIILPDGTIREDSFV